MLFSARWGSNMGQFDLPCREMLTCIATLHVQVLSVAALSLRTCLQTTLYRFYHKRSEISHTVRLNLSSCKVSLWIEWLHGEFCWNEKIKIVSLVHVPESPCLDGIINFSPVSLHMLCNLVVPDLESLLHAFSLCYCMLQNSMEYY